MTRRDAGPPGHRRARRYDAARGHRGRLGVMAPASPTTSALQLLANSLATGAVLVALIVSLQPVSAAFNPVVTLVEVVLRVVPARTAASSSPAQVVGGALGAVLANVMFDLDAISIVDARTHRLRPLGRRGRGDPRPRPGDLRLRPRRPADAIAWAVGRLDRGGLLVHLLDQLRQSGRDHRPDVLRHLRRHQPGVGADVRRSCSSSEAASPSARCDSSTRPLSEASP